MDSKYELMNKNALIDTVTLLKRWLENRNKQRLFSDYLEECGYYSVVIFDAGEIGRLLYDEIKNSKVKILCFYDRNAEGINEIEGIPVYPFSKVKEIPESDIVLVSTSYNYPEVLRLLTEINPTIRSIYLRDAVYEF